MFKETTQWSIHGQKSLPWVNKSSCLIQRQSVVLSPTALVLRVNICRSLVTVLNGIVVKIFKNLFQTKLFLTSGVSVSSEKLDELENRISQLEAEKDGLEVEVERLTKERDSLNEKSSDQEEKITELQQKITELKEDIEEEKKDNEKLRNELDEAANMVAPIGTITPVLAVEGQDVEVGN